MSQSPITTEMSIPEIVAQFPRTEAVFKRHGLIVSGYKALDHESLFATARVHQWPVEEILQELNAVASP